MANYPNPGGFYGHNYYSDQFSQFGQAPFHPYGNAMPPALQAPPSEGQIQQIQQNQGQTQQSQAGQVQQSQGQKKKSGSDKGKVTRERWDVADEKYLIQLWAENLERVESMQSRKAWEEIVRKLNEKKGLSKTVDQCQRKLKALKKLYKERKDWNSKQSGGHIRKSPHYDLLDEVLGCREVVTFSNVQQAGQNEKEHSEGTESASSSLSADSPTSPGPSSTDTAERVSPTTSRGKEARSERKKTTKKRRRYEDESEDEGLGDAIKKLAGEGDQITEVMKGLQTSQQQQMALMTQLLGSFNKYMDKKSGN